MWGIVLRQSAYFLCSAFFVRIPVELLWLRLGIRLNSGGEVLLPQDDSNVVCIGRREVIKLPTLKAPAHGREPTPPLSLWRCTSTWESRQNELVHNYMSIQRQSSVVSSIQQRLTTNPTSRHYTNEQKSNPITSSSQLPPYA
jgi:hypothetical protein